MSIQFPTAKDVLANPAPTDKTTVVKHATQHSDANDAIEALENKVGIDSSADTTSIDYKLKNPASVNPGHKHTEADVSHSLAGCSDVIIATPQDQDGLLYETSSGKWKNKPAPIAKSALSTEGITRITPAPADADHPIALGANFPTVSGNALDGTTNKIVDKTTNDLNELVSNKDTSTSLGTSNTKYPSQNAVKTYVDIQSVAAVVSGITIPASIADDTLQFSNDTQRDATGGSYTKVKETLLNEDLPAVRIKFDAGAGSGTTNKAKIYKNGVAIGTERTTEASSIVTYSEDFTGFVVGDLIQIYSYRSAGSSSSFIQNFRFYFTNKTVTKFLGKTITTPIPMHSFENNPTSNS